jgi:exodeoxyribonuclease-3
MQIITWNVNGLRAALGKGVGNWIKYQSPDILCLQEIKCKPEQLTPEHKLALSPYSSLWNPAQRAGYSGVATFTTQQPNQVIYGFDDSGSDAEGRIIQTKHNDFWLMNIYFPNGQRDQGRLTFKLNFYAQLLDLCDEMHARGEKIILCGDFNTAHTDLDLRNPKENSATSGFLPEERAWIDKYLSHHFVDIFRHLYKDRVQYTWWTYRFNARSRDIGWRLDYFLVSEPLINRVRDVIIYDQVLGSDHCPVKLDIVDSTI